MRPPHSLILAVFFHGGAVSAAVVNIDFSFLSSPADRHSGLAAAPDVAGSSALWNNIIGSAGTVAANNLLSSTGASTTWDISISGVTGSKKSASEQEVATSGPGAGPYDRLMEDYLELDSGANTSIATANGSISGLVAGNSYDIYFYGQGSDMIGTDASSSGENSLFTINSVSKQTGWDGIDGGNRLLENGVEYVKFSVVADGSGNIFFSWSNVIGGVNVISDKVPSNTGTGSRFAALNGIQIVDVPEPSVLLMAGLGMAGLLVRRRA
jgi:hypothetical protein